MYILTNTDGSFENFVIGSSLSFIANTITKDRLNLNNMICLNIKTNTKLLKKYELDENIKCYIDQFDYINFVKQFIPEVFMDGNSTHLHKIIHYKYTELPKEINECIKIKGVINKRKINKIIDNDIIMNRKYTEKKLEYFKLAQDLNAELRKNGLHTDIIGDLVYEDVKNMNANA